MAGEVLGARRDLGAEAGAALGEHTRDGASVDRLLAGYKGRLVADAHSVYDHLYATGDVVEVACWAHARRYFYKALGSEPQLAEHALSLIPSLP